MAIFTGAGVAIVTPMKENGEVNYDPKSRVNTFMIKWENSLIIR